MRFTLPYFFRLFLFLMIIVGMEAIGVYVSGKNGVVHIPLVNEKKNIKIKPIDSVEIRVGTFLGNSSRNYYGDSIGNNLQLIWKSFLGRGTTIVTAAKGVEEWFGAGWTGEPLIVKESGKTYLIQGAFDHHLKKIDAATGEVIWNYEYDDILKGTGTIWVNDSAKDPLNRIVILQGSRKGVQNSMASPVCASYRAVSFFTGKEIWRYNVKQTASYSRDVDASALIFSDTAYVGLENGKFISFDPGKNIVHDDSTNHPVIFSEHPLYNAEDNAHHGGNLVTESSPAKIGNHIYITAGSGHVYGYNLGTKAIDWDFVIGSDLDGTPVVTSDSCLLVEVEKQYINGNGGVFKLNPRKDVKECVEWYFPTPDFHFSGWDGGVIGSVCVNDFYNDGSYLHLAAFTGIDGVLNVVQYDAIRKDSSVVGPDGITKYPVPVLKFRHHIGPSISTPVFSKNKLVAAGYVGVNLFSFSNDGNFKLLNTFPGNFEASPSSDQGRIYIASRDGFLYCLGDTSHTIVDEPFVKVVQPKTEVVKNIKPVEAVKPKEEIPNNSKINKSYVTLLIPSAKKRIADQQKVDALVVNNKVEPIKEKVIPKVENHVVIESQPANANFHLIAGVFRSKENATNFKNLWINRGMHASIIVSSKGMFYVSIAESNLENELSPIQDEVKTKYKSETWIFTREE